MITTTIDLLRHGEVQGGARYRGRQDDPLTPLGHQQMIQQTTGRRWDAIISSPLSRCRTFAEQLSRQQNIPLRIDPDWQEIDFGDWEGKTAAQIEQYSAQALQDFYQDPVKNPPPNGETHQAFSGRIAKGWRNTLSDHPGQHILVITHAGVIRMLFSQLLEISVRNSFQIDIGHACLSQFKCHTHDEEDFVQFCVHKPL